ncbi:histidinol-phosphate aminotransferase [Stackebrandtia endophytica]|uniref:Aromatic amino acid aminotransferase n=1 Tax=Stackebrandtia endophytica TaxID=1496996 RepID=A0A543AXS0_9ACTN|nr:histidinol-phosphate transaminase [Stackebrandtia endophytica]TQL77374.1 histidinol-phosphate aminotransferase [Stackebrandtia endophytica]
MSRLTRTDLDALPAYVPGRSPADLARDLGLPEAIKLASNEVPYGPLPGVIEAVTSAAENAHRYPDMGVVALRDAVAQRVGVEASRVVTGCGSVALFEHLVKATCLPGDEVLYSWRSFEAYPIVVAGAGATSVQVPNTPDHRHDLDAMLAAVTDNTKLIVVCNPNNPTGTTVDRAELTRFIDAVPEHILIVLDEAYLEFVTDPEVCDGFEEFGDRPNVAVLRTFSKAWGLAGLRAGYLIAAEPVADAIRKVVTPFSTNACAQFAALAALRAEDEMSRRAALVVAERDRVIRSLRELVPDVPDSQSNFAWLPIGERSVPFAKHCESHGVIVRPFPEGVRVSFGTTEQNDRFLEVAAKFLG